MNPDPQPMTHKQRLSVAQTTADRLIARYGESVKAIGLYGSLARNEDGPYSDIEMFCVLRHTGESRDYEWCAGPWKAEVNVLTEEALREEAAELDGDWALTHGAYVRILPLLDPERCFPGLSELVMDHSPEEFRAMIEEWLAGEVYERIGKVRNASIQKHYQILPTLVVELARHTAFVLGLEHRHLYRTGSSVLDEAARLLNLPHGFPALIELVTSGDLRAPATAVSACNSLWSGLVQWAD